MKKIVPILFSLLLLAGCSDDKTEQNLTGADNYLTFLTLTTPNGISYDGSVAGTEITMEVHYNVDLGGARATYGISEKATVTPDPATVTDWSVDHRFVVTSFSGVDRVYDYRVVYSEIESAGNVTLSSQADVDAFSESGVRVIKGNLVIGNDEGSAAIENLEGLSQLTEVRNKIVIHSSYTGENLEGLRNLVRIGGFSLGFPESVSRNITVTEVSLPAVVEINGTFDIRSQSVSHISLPHAESVTGSVYLGSDRFHSLDLSSLAVIGGDFRLIGSTGDRPGSQTEYLFAPKLSSIGGSLEVSRFESLSGLSLPELATVDNVTVSDCPAFANLVVAEMRESGNIRFTDCPLLPSVLMNSLVSCGELVIVDCALLETLGFESLVSIDGDFILELTSGEAMPLNSFSGLRNVELISGSVCLSRSELENFNEMTGLRSVGGDMTFVSLVSLGEVDLSNISFHGGTVTFDANLRNIEKITGPDSFDGSLVFDANSTLYPLPLFEGFGEITGDVWIRGIGSTNATVLSMDDMRSVGGNLYLFGSQLREFYASALESVGGSLEIANAGYASWDFPSLRKVGGRFIMENNVTNAAGLGLPLLEEVGDGSDPDGAAQFSVMVSRFADFTLPSIKKVNGSVLLTTGTHAATYTETIAMPELTSVAGDLTIKGSGTSASYTNQKVKEIDFSSLESVSGNITISQQGAVTDFSSFAGLFRTGTLLGSWSVTGCGANPSQSDMDSGNYN